MDKYIQISVKIVNLAFIIEVLSLYWGQIPRILLLFNISHQASLIDHKKINNRLRVKFQSKEL